jgi:hypothetical protein
MREDGRQAGASNNKYSGYRIMTRVRSCAGVAALSAMMVTGLAGCASAPAEPVHDRLDTETATTVTVMQAPVELIAEAPLGAQSDPFAYVAPFETDRMGERALYLWISMPQVTGPLSEPKVSCDGHLLSLQAVSTDLAQFNLSRPPYNPPAPWSGQWYFKLSPESLQCLGTAQGISLETQLTQGQGDAERFSASGKALSELQAFAVAQRDTGAARR